jgi:alpha-1,6-mannosyltransferase
VGETAFTPAPRGKSQFRLYRSTWIAIFVAVAAFAAVPPLFSHDIYSYVDYARLGVLHGLDPYVHRPDAAPADPAFAHVTWTHVTSAYGPLFTLVTYPLARLPVWAAVAALKAAVAASVLSIAVLVARIAPSRGVNPLGAAAFVALNPVVLLQVVGGGHNDAIATLAATVGVAAVLAERQAGGGAAFVAAAAIKLPAAIAAPFALVGAREATNRRPAGDGRREAEDRRGVPALSAAAAGPAIRLVAGAAVAAVSIGLAAYAAFGWHWLHALDLLGHRQSKATHLSVPSTFSRLTGLDPAAVRTTALILYAALFAYLLIRTWQGHDWLRNAAWASLALLLATAWLLPWYLILALPLVALSRDRPLQLLTLTLTAFQLFARVPL